jgi:hypothetical protein
VKLLLDTHAAIIEPMHRVTHDRKMAACVETAITW